MRLVTVGAAVIETTPLAWEGNLEVIRAAIAEARARGVSILCLPELCLTGYGCEDAFHASGVAARAWRQLEAIAPETKGMAVALGLPVALQGGMYNCVAMVVDGHIAGLVGKQHLAGDGLHYEPRWFKPWPAGVSTTIATPTGQVPIGDLFFDLGGVVVGFEICEDAWVGDRPGARLCRRGVDLILNPSASHFAFGKQEVRRRYVLEGSRAFGLAYVSSNLLGNEAGRVIYDGGALIAAGGIPLAEGPRLSFRSQVVTSAVVDLELGRLTRVRLASHRPELGEGLERRVRVDWSPPPSAVTGYGVLRSDRADWDRGYYRKEEELARAVALGLWGYLRKSRSRGFVVSLSGGADSAATACLVALMVELAVVELGLEAVCATLAELEPRLATCGTPRELVGALLTTAYQATRNSSEATRSAAAAVAEAIGADHHELDVDELVQGYVALAEAALGRRLTWEHDDVALQNVQARVRSPSVWILANVKGALLLSTSNRSEAAVGYATMDGDTSGGLAPLAGIDKAFLLRWLDWLQEHGPAGVGPIPALSAITQLEPTAELRPPASGQTDEADLMPYEVLDVIERLAVRDKRMPEDILPLLEAQLPGYPRPQLAAWIERFLRLWSRNQWKRERYAPSFHLDDENLDPRSWCRFPILSGGFETELAELRRSEAE